MSLVGAHCALFVAWQNPLHLSIMMWVHSWFEQVHAVLVLLSVRLGRVCCTPTLVAGPAVWLGQVLLLGVLQVLNLKDAVVQW